MKVLALTLAVFGLLVAASTSNAATDWRAYAKTQAAKAPYRWVGPEWLALDAIVTPESGWQPCAVNPGRVLCGYDGPSSCGIPQRSPCPSAWRGRLGTTAREQVRELLRYVRERYRTPVVALEFRRAHGYY